MSLTKASQSTPSYDEIQTKLESLKEEHDRISQGHRLALYKLLQKTTEMALLVESNDSLTFKSASPPAAPNQIVAFATAGFRLSGPTLHATYGRDRKLRIQRDR
jgi:hypothetical protein